MCSTISIALVNQMSPQENLVKLKKEEEDEETDNDDEGECEYIAGTQTQKVAQQTLEKKSGVECFNCDSAELSKDVSKGHSFVSCGTCDELFCPKCIREVTMFYQDDQTWCLDCLASRYFVEHRYSRYTTVV